MVDEFLGGKGAANDDAASGSLYIVQSYSRYCREGQEFSSLLGILRRHVYRIEVPYWPRWVKRRTQENICKNHYPPKGVSPYTFDEAMDILQIVTRKWTENRRFPPPFLEPRAYAVRGVEGREYEDIHPPLTFSLREILQQYWSSWNQLGSLVARKDVSAESLDEREYFSD